MLKIRDFGGDDSVDNGPSFETLVGLVGLVSPKLQLASQSVSDHVHLRSGIQKDFARNKGFCATSNGNICSS